MDNVIQLRLIDAKNSLHAGIGSSQKSQMLLDPADSTTHPYAVSTTKYFRIFVNYKFTPVLNYQKAVNKAGGSF